MRTYINLLFYILPCGMEASNFSNVTKQQSHSHSTRKRRMDGWVIDNQIEESSVRPINEEVFLFDEQ